MCGIIGFYTFKNHVVAGVNYDDYMEQGLTVTSLRGKDSTGIFAATPQEIISFKKAYSASDFVEVRGARQVFSSLRHFGNKKSRKRQGALCIGHTRAATLGSVTSANAHPFHIKNIVLAHNGTIHSKKTGYTQTDSESIATEISDIEDRSVENVLEYLKDLPDYGAYSLVWYDFEDHSINFARNKDRPMSFVFNEDNVLYGSEPDMVILAGRRTGILKNKYTVQELPIHTYKKISLGKKIVEDHTYVPKPPIVYTTGQNYRAGANSKGSQSSSATKGSSRDVKQIGFVSFLQQAFCAWCRDPIPDRDIPLVARHGKDLFCDDCINTPEVEEYAKLIKLDIGDNDHD